MPEIRSVLITRLSAIGDVIHALPLLEVLRSQLPHVRIGWVVEELSAPLLLHHPDIDKLYVIPKKRWRGNFRKYLRSEILPFYKTIRHDGWDASIDPQGLSKSAIAGFASGARLRIGFRGENAREVSSLLYNRRIAPRPDDVHVAAQNLRLLEGLGLRVPEIPPRGSLGLRDDEREAMRAKLRDAGWRGEPLVALNPGAGWRSKRWAPSCFAELGVLIAHRTGLRPIVLWGPKEDAARDEIVAAVKVVNGFAAPATSVRELAVLISQCSLFVGGDTGATHMAGLLGIPVISIFGASDSARNCPWPAAGPAPAGIPVQRNDLFCVPCWKVECPLVGEQHMACLRGLSPVMVMERVESLLAAVKEGKCQ